MVRGKVSNLIILMVLLVAWVFAVGSLFRFEDWFALDDMAIVVGIAMVLYVLGVIRYVVYVVSLANVGLATIVLLIGIHKYVYAGTTDMLKFGVFAFGFTLFLAVWWFDNVVMAARRGRMDEVRG